MHRRLLTITFLAALVALLLPAGAGAAGTVVGHDGGHLGTRHAAHRENHRDPRGGHLPQGVGIRAEKPSELDDAIREMIAIKRPVIFDCRVDKHANVLGSKGLGELGICGAGAAVANAVYNACGARVREYPITLDKVLPALTRRQG